MHQVTRARLGVRSEVSRTVRMVVRSRWIVPLLLVLGVLERTIWASLRMLPYDAAEAGNVAVAIATGRGLADTYYVGSGPTAHLMPTTPVLAGAVYRALGVATPAAGIVLGAIALAQVAAIHYLLFRLFERLAVPRAACVMALAWVCLVAVYIFQETYMFRFWDGGLACLLGLACLNDMVALDNLPSARPSRMMWSAMLLGATMFVTQTVGLAASLGYLLMLVRRGDVRAGFGFIVTAILVAACFYVPWTARNYVQLGVPIVTRSNAGLELAVANHDQALAGSNQENAFYDRLKDIHPLQPGRGQAAVRRMGEVRYFAQLRSATMVWILDHPTGFARLSVRHVVQMFYPEPWQIGANAPVLRAWMIRVISTIGIAGLAYALVQRRRYWAYPAIFVGVLAVSYAPFQPTIRYAYPLYGILVFSATALVASLLARIGGRWLRE